MLFIIEYDCAHYCGASHYCLVDAINVGRALGKADGFMHTHMRELFSSEYDEDHDEDCDECAYHVIEVKPFNEYHPCWEFYLDPSQAEFYPKVQ